MGKVRVNINGPVTNKESVDLNCHTEDENKEISNAVTGVLGEGQGILKEDEVQVTDNLQVVNDAQTEAVQVQVLSQSGQQSSEQQLQDPSVCWEGFLPTKSLKVLVVEDDDSTRRVICALLRKCGYEVTAVASGLQAWNLLKDHSIHVDLVLTEVVMPGPSGIDLLSKMMSHKTCKDIPVIMMSSNDSLSMVFKCLSKGAVDFLVKPIRKNELKNLWQHAWRKCRSSSGSASENGVQTQKTTSTSLEESDKNTGSNHEDDNEIIGVNASDESDKGSGTEITQVIIRSSPETFGNDLVPAVTTRECEGQNEELGAVITGTELGMGVPKIPNLQLEEPKERGLINIVVTSKDKLSKMKSQLKDDDKLKKGQVELNNEKPNEQLENQAVDLIGVTTNSTTDPQMQSGMFNIPSSVSKVPGIRDKDINESKEIASLELSLKTQTDARNTGFSVHDQNALRHLDLSAPSRYNFPTTSNQAGSVKLASHSPLDSSSEEEKAKPLPVFLCNLNSTPLYHSNECSNNNNMDSATNDFLAEQKAVEDKPELKSTIKHLQSSSAFQPHHDSLLSLSHQPIIQGKADAAFGSTILTQGTGMNQQVLVEHHHLHYHNHHHVHSMPQHQQIPNHDELSGKNMAAEAPCFGPSDVPGTPIEGNVGNHSLHGSEYSGSDHSSDEQNTSSSPIDSRGKKEGTISPIEVGNKSGVDQNHVSKREAALNKFRQKRKERCFDKKVRYQSRKKLADQRPRVRGKFVQREVHENKGKDTHS
ncbi:two-component response regulator-like APRR3 [Rosa sericea]